MKQVERLLQVLVKHLYFGYKLLREGLLVQDFTSS